jgi:hypothetical protein
MIPMKVKVEAEDGDVMPFDLVKFSGPGASVDDWSAALTMFASASEWVTPMLLLDAAMSADMSKMHMGWWARENKEALIKFRDELTRVIGDIKE